MKKTILMLKRTIPLLGASCLLVLPFTLTLPASAQEEQDPAAVQQESDAIAEPASAEEEEDPFAATQESEAEIQDPNTLRPLTQSDSFLSLQGGERLMNEAQNAINNLDYELAINKLQEARQVFNQLSNFYQQLSNSFSGIDSRIAEAHRDNALSTAQSRDEATYQLALVHRATEQSELSVPLLIQIIRSQNPTSELGKKSYQQLFELGFVESPYPRPRGESTSSSN